jgi:hypothetical protein
MMRVRVTSGCCGAERSKLEHLSISLEIPYIEAQATDERSRSLSCRSEAQRGAQRGAAAAAADKDASERRLQDAEAKIQEITMELERKDEVIRCVLHTFSTYLPLACDVG